MHIKQQFFSARCLCYMDSLRASRTEIPGGKTNRRFKCLVYKTNTTYYEISTLCKCVEK